MNIEELEEALSEVLSFGFEITTNKKGEVIILTGMKEDEDGELISLEEEDDPDADPDFEPLEDEEDEDE